MGRAFAFVLLGIVLSGFGLLMLRGDENTWICESGMWVKHGNPRGPEPIRPCSTKRMSMKLTSPSFAPNAEIPVKYSCQGAGTIPTLTISDIPKETITLAITLEDPDAPMGTFQHWLVWNIDPKTTDITEGNVPDGSIVGTNSTGKAGYIPPCPPNGTHRYIFTVFALSTSLHIPETTGDRNALDAAMAGRVIAMSSITGRYTRK